MQHICLHPHSYGGVQGAAAMPQTRFFSHERGFEPHHGLTGKGAADPAANRGAWRYTEQT